MDASLWGACRRPAAIANVVLLHRGLAGAKFEASPQVSGANCYSSRCWQLIQTETTLFPAIIVQTSDPTVPDCGSCTGGTAVECTVSARAIVVIPEVAEPSLKIKGVF